MAESTVGSAGSAATGRDDKRKRGDGLSIQRVHTTAGVHPYDEVTWQRRDVVMTNWRDGTVNFEQRGVEFPDFWSVNATNIVTSKYFRGAVGTPVREHSLRQLIDRVVSKYVAAGLDNGYFATETDAEVFGEELTWMLLHQVFSFNSPVWFNVGTSSPQQVSACQPYDALVSTPAGLIPIGRLVEDDAVGTKVYDAHGLTKIVATKSNGVREVLRLHTKAGHTLDVTSDHVVWKSTAPGSGQWVEAGTLKPGDQLEWHRRPAHGESEIVVAEVAEAALAGWLQSDGFVGQYEGTNRSLTIEAMTVTPAELDWVTAALDTVFPRVHRHERAVATQDTTLDCRRTRLYGTVLSDFVERWSLRARGVDMVVPEHLFSAPLPVVACYLRSLFQAEGYVSHRERSTLLGMDMISEQLIRGVQALLGRFGIFARVARKRDPRPDRHDLWGIRIQNAGDRRIFADEIGFIDPAKEAKLEASFDLPGGPAREVKRLEIDRVETLQAVEVYDIQTESGEYLSGGLRVHNCFILSVDDTMDSILNWYREEGLIFKGGSGAGLNLSRLRSSKELLSSGGTASGPVSFMRGADASAGTIKSGGATRRAAKMVVLDVDHPDIEEFVQTKAREEEKIRVLRDAGFDMDLGGSDITSVQYQNANNSVRVTDEFMRAVESDGVFGLRARTTNDVIETVAARKLFGTISEAAWACADPGIQYDDTINDWHTCPESGRITASNPCFPADQRVVTDAGLIPIGELVRRAAAGETVRVYTNDVTNAEACESRVVPTRPSRYMVTGTNEILELRFADGSRLRCTPNHRVWTANSGWVRADELTAADSVVRSLEHAARPYASTALPALAVDAARYARGRALEAVPEKWTAELAQFIGWLVGDGCLTKSGAVTVYAGEWERERLLPQHSALLTAITGFRPKPSVQPNGTVQLRSLRGRLATFLRMLGVSDARSPEKVVPASIYEAPEEVVTAFLRGLFDADGCVVNQVAKGTRYVGLGSRSEELLIGVQELLASLGVGARIYRTGTRTESFSYVRKDGSAASYGSDGPTYDLRITGRHLDQFAALIGFEHVQKAEKLATVRSGRTWYRVDESTRLVSRVSRGFETTYNLTEPRNHSYVVSGVVVANCSEYLHLDNSSCNLASLNLLKFLNDDQSFDATRFAKSVELIITAMDISICFADFPTEAIGDTTRAFRQLGIGYANLGALLMATGHGYDSEGGRTLAASITSLMTAAAYRRSAELAGAVGPYDGYARNAEPHQRVMRKHAAANDQIRPLGRVDGKLHKQATKAWQECLKVGERNGWRNAQASVLAPTGCLTADTLVTTDRGLARLGEIGDVYGSRWQDLNMTVSTDDGERRATKFFVNGEEPTRRIVTEGGYTVQGTLGHRIKVVHPSTGGWEWKRLADVAPGDIVPMQLGTLVGAARAVPLPVLDEAYYTGQRHLRVPDAMDADLAELVGYFMGDGSLHAKGIRLCVADADLDVVDRLQQLTKGLFGIEADVSQQPGYQEVTISSIRLARWWRATGFAKWQPTDDHIGKGWRPHIPSAVLETNDPEIYAAFIRGLFEADGTVLEGVPSVSTASESLASEVRTLLLALGMATTTRETTSGWGGAQFQVRLRNLEHALIFDEFVGFIGDRKARLLSSLEPAQSGNRDRVCLPREVWDELVPVGHACRNVVVNSLRKAGGVSRTMAGRLFADNLDKRLGHAIGYLFERVRANADGGLQPTYDLSVPDNVTYVAAGFVSHNTIGLMMDCDTTGVEPDLALVKFKKLVGGGSMQIVNQTVPRALASLGYQSEQVEAVVEYISEHGHVVDAPGLRQEHYEVFDCAMGERSIAPMGHVRMMAAVQPFISGAISKTVNMPEAATVADVEQIYTQGWKLGLKALAIYRDNCKVGQPLSSVNKSADAAKATAKAAAAAVEARPVRKRLPKKRPSQTVSFTVGGAEGYLTAGSYPDDGLGEIFVKMSKQGSTLAGVMDAFSIAISIALQYGVPLETYVSKFVNMRFEPAGMTDDPDVRIATSVVDYLFRRAALDFLPYDKRVQLGIFSADERTAELDAGGAHSAAGTDVEESVDEVVEELRTTVPAAEPAAAVDERPTDPSVGSLTELVELQLGKAADAPLCMTCGTKMRPAGSCYVCEGCGSTSGCS
ncbi:MAG: LAGLIDADG family homing endonuclease [Pseudonocardia sp.]